MAHYHFVGVGGIGMSGLAAAVVRRGDRVTGSDRSAGKPENARILSPLIRAGIEIFPQDGSFIEAGKPDFLVVSSAIEADNPDLLAAPDIPRLHRSELLRELIDAFPGVSIAVTGSCGKSSVTAYIAETLLALGVDVDCLNGALIKNFITPELAGNYRPGDGKYLVFESDESDKSLLNYQCDFAVVLNLGHDHYEESELIRVFSTFINRARRGAVLGEEVYRAVRSQLRPDLPVAVFGADPAQCTSTLTDYRIVAREPVAEFNAKTVVRLPQVGRHTALNALAVLTLLKILGFAEAAIAPALSVSGGVWRRCDFAGLTASGARVFDDYAHNPEKIISCLSGLREITPGKILAVFQPHGYGPFGFMEAPLLEMLEKFLGDDDVFYLGEPYYAGGTSSLRPTAAEVLARWREKSTRPELYRAVGSRESLREELLAAAGKNDTIVIMGARDNSLSDYARSFAAKP